MKKSDKHDDAASTANSVSKLKKDFKKMSKAFTTGQHQVGAAQGIRIGLVWI
jgi:hypothetical protein